jgi:hypothetical protein
VVEYSELMLSVLEAEVQDRAPNLFALYGVSDSAEAIFRRRSRFADARLVWLYEPERPEQEDYDLAGG